MPGSKLARASSPSYSARRSTSIVRAAPPALETSSNVSSWANSADDVDGTTVEDIRGSEGESERETGHEANDVAYASPISSSSAVCSALSKLSDYVFLDFRPQRGV